ncbi:MAG TPA: O-antigen ligase family protein [Edaphobacter sp.]
MGLFLTLLYIMTAYMGPQTLWGPLYEFHVELILAALAFIASLPQMQQSKLFSIPQTYALIGMCVAVFCSMVMTGWMGSIAPALLGFIPNAFTFLLIVVNCKTKRHLQLVVLVFFIVCAHAIFRGYSALRAEDYLNPYLMPQGEEGTPSRFYRLRGMAFINDPNDFSQVMVSLIPCLFFFWKKRNILLNIPLVLAPVGILIFGMFLTHSRGGIIALLAVLLFGARRKIGTIPAAIIAAGGFAATMAIGWSGGRNVNVEEGSGRMEAWATGLDLIKSHPLFGVGLGRFSEYFFITAHNTVVVCAAELGMFGLFWWVMFVLPTARDAIVCSLPDESETKKEDEFPYPYARKEVQEATPPLYLQRPSEMNVQADSALLLEEAAPHEEERGMHPYFGPEQTAASPLPPEEIRRIAQLMLVSIIGYFVAGWFLSRAYIMTLFIYGGMVQVIYRMALDQGIAPPRMKAFKIVQYSAIGSVFLIFVVYIMLRLQHLMPK